MTEFSARSRRNGVRSLIMAALASVSPLAVSAAAFAQPVDETSRAPAHERQYDIPAQPLSSALMRFAEQSDLQILFSESDVAGFQSRPQGGRSPPPARRH
jgi:hypothetical protein